MEGLDTVLVRCAYCEVTLYMKDFDEHKKVCHPNVYGKSFVEYPCEKCGVIHLKTHPCWVDGLAPSSPCKDLTGVAH